MKLMPTYFVVFAYLAIAALPLPVDAQAATEANAAVTDDVIYACVKKKGKVRIVSVAGQCRRGEEEITWNVQGPKGEPGPQGEQGEPGPDMEAREALCLLFPLMHVTAPAFCLVDTQGNKVVFRTAETYTGDLGGMDGADAKCQTAAANAGLQGTFLAWIATDDINSPVARFQKAVPPGKYVDTQGFIIADSWEDLTDGWLHHPISKDQFGNTSPPAYVWTNVNDTANVNTDNPTSFNTCNGFTDPGWEPCDPWAPVFPDTPVCNASTQGHSGHQDSKWTQIRGAACWRQGALYCFQQ